MNRNELLDKLNWRYAVKLFDSTKKISSDDWKILESALILTPSSYGLQPWKFLVVTSEDLKQKLTPLSWNQKQVASCSHYVVLLAKDQMTEDDVSRYMQRISDVRGTDVSSLNSFKNAIIGDVVKGDRSQWVKEWATRQVYIALGNLMTSAAMLEIDTCPMEGIDQKKYDDVLELNNSGYHTVVACAVGYRSAEDKYQNAKKVRFETKDLISYR